MSTIRCHFDGRVIVPDEEVDLPVNQRLLVRVENGVAFVDHRDRKSATVGELRAAGFVGAWKHRSDITDSLEYARDLRRRAEEQGGGAVIVLDTDVAVDVLRAVPTAAAWFDSLPADEIVVIPGFVAMELIFGTLDSKDQRETQRWLAACRTVWLEPDSCQRAYETLAATHLANAIGVIGALVAQVAISLDSPLLRSTRSASTWFLA